jgi:hypothetical protein
MTPDVHLFDKVIITSQIEPEDVNMVEAPASSSAEAPASSDERCDDGDEARMVLLMAGSLAGWSCGTGWVQLLNTLYVERRAYQSS